MADHRPEDQQDRADGGQRAERGGGHILRQADAVVIEQDGGNADARRKALVVGEGGNENAQGDEGGAHDKERRDGPVGGQEIHLAELGEDERVQADQAQGEQVDREQGKVFARDHLCGGNGQRVQKLVGFLPALLGDHPHGEDRHDDHEHQASEAENELKIADRGLDVVQHGADADERQQKRAEHIGGQGMEIEPQFVL